VLGQGEAMAAPWGVGPGRLAFAVGVCDERRRMQRRHKTLFAAGAILLLVGWLAWTHHLTESEEPTSIEQTD
jgi:hypothetical protein